jgi:hypothetical protein
MREAYIILCSKPILAVSSNGSFILLLLLFCHVFEGDTSEGGEGLLGAGASSPPASASKAAATPAPAPPAQAASSRGRSRSCLCWPIPAVVVAPIPLTRAR